MYIHLGDIIKELRLKKGWSQRQLALYAGIGRRTVASIEMTGHGNIDNIESMLGVMGYELEVVPKCGR